MKNKRLAILFVMITVGGSPQVWQQLSNLVAAVQHKAQITFLSMVLTPRTGSDEAQANLLAQSNHLASCEGLLFNQVRDDFKAKADSSQRKLRTQQRTIIRAEEPEGLPLTEIARVEEGESLPRQHNPAHAALNPLTMHSLTAVPPQLAMNKTNVVEVVVLPQLYTVAPAFIESANLFKLKKSLDENKAVRVKTRYIRPVLPIPPSKAEAIGGERAG